MDKYIDPLKDGLSSWEKSQRQEDLAENEGKRWKDCLFYLSKAEFSEMALELIHTKSLSFDEVQSTYKIDLFLHIFVNLLCNKQKDQAKPYIIRFGEAISQYHKEEFKLDRISSISNFDFNKNPIISFRIINNNENFYDKMKSIKNYLETHLRMCLEKEQNLEEVLNITEFIIEYFDIYIKIIISMNTKMS
jgi:hypothetical protein